MWIIKNNLFQKNLLLHRHDNIWVESYEKDNNVYCCKCDEEYTKKELLTLLDIFPRPNNRAYLEIYNYFRRKTLRINPSPPEPNSWTDWGHIHGEEEWKPVIISGKKTCPNCLELAPEKEYKDLIIVENLEIYFLVKKKIKDEIIEIKVQLV